VALLFLAQWVPVGSHFSDLRVYQALGTCWVRSWELSGWNISFDGGV
jgi:hypothetical protein